MEDVLVEQCGEGVCAYGTGVVGRCANVEVKECGWSGVVASRGASIILIGDKTTVHHNCTRGEIDDYGLEVNGASTIQLVSPLTKEIVSVNNGGGGNWGAYEDADINQIRTEVQDCLTLQEAVNRMHEDDQLTTIVLGKGEHRIDGDYLEICSAMNIVGDPGLPKSEIVVVGGIQFKKGIKGNCHVEHLTLRQAKQCGVFGQSAFTMEDVLVDQCDYGVFAYGAGVVGRCTDVEVRQCGQSGVAAYYGASITLIGAKTTVHHNCTKEKSWNYGLQVWGSSSSTIQLVSPLSKEKVSTDNSGGGTWGAYNGDIRQIKTISQ